MTQPTDNPIRDLVDRILEVGGDVTDAAKSGELQDRAKALWETGEDKLAGALNIPDTPEARAKFSKQAKIGAGVGGLALLLSGRARRNTAKLAGLGAVGALAYAAYKKNGGKIPTTTDELVGLLKGPDAEDRALALLTAMVAAAQADGQITNSERAMLLDAGDEALVESIMAERPSARDVADMATSAQAGREIYAVSCRIADGLNDVERDYLDRLAMSLELEPEVAAMIETEMRV